MALSFVYDTGTITVNGGATALTGSGTLWLAHAMSGDTFFAAGLQSIVESVDSNTGITLAAGWPGGNLAGAAYQIVKNSPLRSDATTAARNATTIVNFLAGVGVIHPVAAGGTPDPDLGENDQYALDFEYGRWWKKAGGVWGNYNLISGNIADQLRITGDISPAQITADQNDYNPTGLSTASVLRLSTDATRTLTGVGGGTDGRVLLVHNVGTQNIVLKDESASSSAANRFALVADLTLTTDAAALLQYDATSARWRAVRQLQREMLHANRTIYVRPDGSDGNDGYANDAGHAFLTVQKAVDVVAAFLDLGGFVATVQIADGTYVGNVSLKNVVGAVQSGSLIIKGNAASPANVVLQGEVSGQNLVSVWRVQDMTIGGAGADACLSVLNAGVEWTNIVFGTCTIAHIWCQGGRGYAAAQGNYAISGSALSHFREDGGGTIVASGRTVNLSGTPNFSTGFALLQVGNNALIAHLMTFTGSGATGPRFNVSENSTIYTGGGGPNYFPGDSAGSTATGGQYI